MVYPTTFVLYADYRFGWGSEMVGYHAGAGRRAVGDRAGRLDQADRRQARRTPRAAVRIGLRHVRLRAVRDRADRLLVLGDDAGRRVVRRRAARRAGDHDAPRRSARTGPSARRRRQSVERRRHHRADAVHAAVRAKSRNITCRALRPARRSGWRARWSPRRCCSRGIRYRICRKPSMRASHRRKRNWSAKSPTARATSSRPRNA